MIFNAHFSSFEPRKPLETLCTTQCLLCKVHFSETEKKNLNQIRCSVRTDITISREKVDNTWENWQHKPVQPSTATSAWLLTRERCNFTHLAGNTQLRIGRAPRNKSCCFGSVFVCRFLY
jgi:hypothetical protein